MHFTRIAIFMFSVIFAFIVTFVLNPCLRSDRHPRPPNTRTSAMLDQTAAECDA